MKPFTFTALAAAAMLSTGLATAGTLQVTPVQYAAETIVEGNPLLGPVFSYALASPISVSSSPQFDIDFELDNAVWDIAANTQLPGPSSQVFYLVSQDGTVSIRARSISYPIAGNNRVLRLRFNMEAGSATGEVGGQAPANYTFPVGSNIVIGTSAIPPVLLGTAAMTLPANQCDPVNVDTRIKVRMYNSLGTETSETAIGSPINFVQSSTYLRSSGALSITVGPAVDLTTGAALETSRIDVTTPSLGKQFTVDAADTTPTGSAIAIGQLRFQTRGTFKDATVGATGNYVLSDRFDRGPSTQTEGRISLDRLNLTILGRFNTAGSVYMSRASNCSTAIFQNTGADSDVIGDLQAPSASRQAVLTTTSATFTNFRVNDDMGDGPSLYHGPGLEPRVFICYKRDVSVGGSLIPASQFVLDSARSNVVHIGESGSPVCGVNMYNLRQNGVQVDLRNVVAKTSPAYAEGWRSFVRVVNTDEAQATAVSGQVIKSDGVVLGSAVLIASLAPRAYRFISTDQIEVALAGSASAGYTATDGANYRLRLTAPSASLRVQNYLFNPTTGNYMEASGSQGDEQPGNAASARSVGEGSRK